MLDLRDLSRPVVAAPMAGGASTPALAAAVTESGGLGYVAAGYKTAAAVADDLAAARAATSGPLAVNLFVVERCDPGADVLAGYRADLEPEAARLGATLGEPAWDDDDWQGKLDLVLDVRPDLVSFTFGCPDADVLRRLAEARVHTAVTVTTADEAREAVARGARSLLVQGPDAGAHRGTWDLLAVPAAQPLPDLLRDVLAAVDVPVVAGGGVMDATGVEALVRAGAVAALCGTAYLLADEAGTNPVHRAALTDPAFEATALTRAYTGRWARGLANRFMAEHPDAPAAYPQLHHLTSPLRKAAVAAGDPQVAHLWAGTGHTQARPGPAAELTRSLTP
ncbi:nitronate monooxygenase [Nocardioides iriomotensis]|uniref:Propionate 3-nitronate monooxygenase n=1 Tax=Nocardioides iriomotensis TaxID=715784 RepID=A0A4Q5J1B4_9ACTN|nr:nitronate monooxygenase [Nocardioides iriomotensis]RYU11211.1 nitronate monooxygenase [Nocardioides iriomotensis]